MKIYTVVHAVGGSALQVLPFATRSGAEEAFRELAQIYADDADIEAAIQKGKQAAHGASVSITESDLGGISGFAIEEQRADLEDAKFDMKLWGGGYGTLAKITAFVDGEKSTVAYAVNGEIARQLTAGIRPITGDAIHAEIAKVYDGDPQFSDASLSTDSRVIGDVIAWNRRGQLEGIVDENEGGIVAYCHTDNHDRLISDLNIAALAKRKGIYP